MHCSLLGTKNLHSAKATFPRFSAAAGFELNAVQCGLEPADWKPMNDIGSGVKEIRIHVLGEWRIIYVAKFAEAIYVLNAFPKKTQKTSKQDIDLARQRYKQIGATL